MRIQDPYLVLGLGRDASDKEIKRAWRNLARQAHPDRNPDDPGSGERFLEIQAAYAILSDPEQRARADAGEAINTDELGSLSFEGLLSELFGLTAPGTKASAKNKGVSSKGFRAGLASIFSRAQAPVRIRVPEEISRSGGTIALDLGNGRVIVRIPAGVKSGQRLRLPDGALVEVLVS